MNTLSSYVFKKSISGLIFYIITALKRATVLKRVKQTLIPDNFTVLL